MKKILCLAVCAIMLFALAACGDKGSDASSTDTGSTASSASAASASSIKFDAEKYDVRVDGYNQISEHLTV